MRYWKKSYKHSTAQHSTAKDGILTLAKSQNFKETLNNEINKLKNFDVVLAVVGTMKAGKSTTINAIVGREILPNRNRPMTALPTLICHNPNNQIPKISFQPKVLNEFLDKLRPKLDLIPISDAMHEDMKNLIAFIKNGGEFHTYYEGEEKIFEFLYKLNDLVRLSKEIGLIQEEQGETDILTFPFDQYKNFNNLPRIDVAFNLKNDFETQGRFMLLDTAGPNEAGQDELKEALAEQLERSSAVLIILDYTQLNSDAEKDVKDQIEKIPSVQKSRLFALVNKYDQKNSNADEADATRKHIFHNLLKDKIELDNIYAISAQDSYLANRMKTHIDNQKSLPEYQEQTWVEDFAKKLYGKRAKQSYKKSDIEEIQEDIQDLIEDSRMAEPMQNVIVNMQKNAPFIAMQSALAGASEVFDNLHNVLDIRGFFAKQEKISDEQLKKLNDSIKELQKQADELEDKKNNLTAKLDETIKNINKQINLQDKVTIIKLETKDKIQELFDEESSAAKKQEQEVLAKNNSLLGFIERLTKLKSEAEVAKEKAELDRIRDRAKSDGYRLIFSDEKHLQEFQDKASEAVEIFINQSVIKAFDEILESSIEEVKKVTKDINQESANLLQDLKGSLQQEDIQLRISFDGLANLDKHSATLSNLKLKFHKKNHKETRKQSGFFGRVKRGLGGFLGKDWGTYEVNYTNYIIIKSEIIGQLMDSVTDDVIEPLQQQVHDKIQTLLETSTDYIDEFGEKINDIINEVQKGIENEHYIVQQSHTEQENYKQKILKLKNTHEELAPDWDKVAQVFDVEKIENFSAKQ